MVFVSQDEIRTRRQQLQRRRLCALLQTLWRSLFVSGCAGGLAWTFTLPQWAISQPEQIEIAGNQLLSTPTIRELLPVSEARSLLQLEPERVAEHLQARAPIAEVRVARQFLPFSVVVEVAERPPVAVTVPDRDPASGELPSAANTPGFLDATGIWLPEDSYRDPDARRQELPLSVKGYQPQYRLYWSRLYAALPDTSVRVTAIDWRDPTNLKLQTELGSVHLGSETSQFAEQLQALARLQSLPQKVPPHRLAHIDLKNPDAPSVRLKN